MQTDRDSRGGNLPAHRSTFGDCSSKARQREGLAEPCDQIIQLIKRGIDEQFKNSWNNYVLVEKNLATLKRTVEINDEMYKLTLADFQAGNTPIMAVFGMKTAHIMSEVAYANAQIDLLIARYQLHKVLGLVNPLIK